MYWVHILYSPSTDSFYKGQTNNLEARLEKHNRGQERYTRKGIPWDLKWKTSFENRSEAVVLEMKLKNLSRERLAEFMLKYKSGCVGPDVTPFA